MNPPAAHLWRHLRVFQIWGSNTDVGKTIFATTLCKAAAKHYSHEKVAFLKPVSTGAPHEADSWHMRSDAPDIANDTLFQYEVACSPHAAASYRDSAVLAEIRSHAARRAALGSGWLFIETAGGVHSLGPSGTPQADLYAPMRVPALLVGDSKLGGISQTLAAYESLKLRGQDVEAIMLFQDAQYENHLYLQDYFQPSGVPVYTIPKPPQRNTDDRAEHRSMGAYYKRLSSDDSMRDLLANLDKRPSDEALLQPAFDRSASWWTQGLDHGNPKLTLAAAYAAGRYGHVMFASSVHEPALALAGTLLENMRNPRLARVFYSDNGSTGCEVATKMALRAARLRYGWSANDKVGILALRGSYHGDTMGAMDCSEPGVFNEKVEWYTGKGHWLDFPTVRCHEGQWQVDIPKALQADLGCGGETFESLDEVFRLDERIGSATHKAYEDHILRELQRLASRGHKFGALMLEPVVLGARWMILADPLFQRTLVDVVRSSGSQLFSTSTQHSLPDDSPSNADWSGLPVIFDEVFVGLYRLGRFSAASLLGVHPDISVHAKLLTGGLMPLCATLASESIFAAFESDDKSDALLHGHSYTAHPVSCQVALESLREMNRMRTSGDWSWARRPSQQEPEQRQQCANEAPLVWSVWSSDFVNQVSCVAARIEAVWALGTGSGYKSTAAADLQTRLRSGGDDGSWTAHTRVLGNVFYIMASQKTDKATVRGLEKLIAEALLE
ncbi:bifunctional dethiobiotin synthetase/adenosylmethionine-8-amino-7-oxononanoate aminotransferase [Microdochium bolleyi]|uniref:Bifunctional dethiobiotin synthetase/adenosylmethionine-8-amino-7-oxononanoate aminotransferase n=1 Tax=Microdochium bolleyi TaxID=196109 RepID=A0A136IK29_9PEZI|nr:bifunctional dethiobiotin synthetase/adenosylmethionine-8-amino-7-oxononanoate aminotransferase [Microdochium bolleyi]